MNLLNTLRHKDNQADSEEYIDGERALTSVNKGASMQASITNWTVMIGAIGLAGFMLLKYYSGVYQKHQASKGVTKDLTHLVSTSSLPPLSMPEPEPAKSASASSPGQGGKEAGRLPPPGHTSGGSGPESNGAIQNQVKSPEETILDRRLKRELRFNFQGGAQGNASSAPSGTAADNESSAFPSQVGPANSHSSARETQSPSQNSISRAYLLADPALMMTRGTVIPCTVIPAVDTTLKGVVSCITAEDATGADGKVSLMERGTFCTGFQGGGIAQGQRRVGIVWQRCETPQHVLIPLDAGATDTLGRPGIAGAVDSHFWDRFGGAIALSLIGDLGSYLAATRQGNGNSTTIAFPNILNGPQELMNEVLKNTVNIPPTITAPQGARVQIFLAGDIDFRDVYQLERKP